MNNTPIPVSFECFDYPGHQPNPVGYGPIHDTYQRCFQPIPTFVPPNVPPAQVFPETECSSSKPVPESALLNSVERYKMLQLLADWKLKFLYKTLNEAVVGIEALQFITPAQCESMLNSYPMGIRIKFIAKVKQLQRDYTRASSQRDHRVHVPVFGNTYM